MGDKHKIQLDVDGLDLDFLDAEVERFERYNDNYVNYYKVLIADDEEEVHRMTKLVLKGFDLEGTKLQLFDTYSGKETMEFLNKNNDIAIILLDVVMEEEDAGLKVVKYLRETLNNNVTRIILRTGQPGKAPEEKVIVEYEIDDYKSKTELTVQKLFSTIYVCLRAHKNIKALNRHKEGLHKVINASQDLFKYHSFNEFLNGMLMQVIALYDVDVNSMYIRNAPKNIIDGMAFIQMMDSVKILAATGKYETMIGKTLTSENCSEDLIELIRQIENSTKEELVIRQGEYLGIYKQSADKFIKNYIILETIVDTDNLDLIKLFLTNFSLAIDNFMLNMNVNETQNEIIFRISEIVENRCDSTANHLRRVSNITKILAKRLGFDDEKATSIALASVMHDVGKIGISDDILLKPSKLTADEYEIIKNHTLIGYNIFKDSKLDLLNQAADIALYHHERYDGKGYPFGKKRGEIPKACEIVAVADVFDALISKRCYKDEWTEEDVIGYFKENRGNQFSPDVVDTLLDNIQSILDVIKFYRD